MNYRFSTIFRQVGSSVVPQFGASYTVTVYPVGAVASAGSSAAVFTVDAGHSFVAGDKCLIDPGGDNTFSGSNIVSSVTATTITMDGGAYAVSAGDKIANLGPDTGTASPNYDGSPCVIYSDADGSTAASNSRVTANSQGEYAYWHRADGRWWELIRNSSGTVEECIAGYGGVEGRYNVVDYGANPAAPNNATRIQAAADVLIGLGGNGELYGPKDASLTITTTITLGSSTANAFRNVIVRDMSLVVSGITALTLYEAQDVRVVDVDIDGQESASSKGVRLRNCNFCWVERCTIRDCQTAIHIDSQTGSSQNTLNIINNHLYIGQLSTDTTGIASSIGIDIDTTDNFIYNNRIYGFVTGIDIDATSNMIRGNHIYKGYPSTNVLQHCLDVTSNNAVIVGNYFDNATVHHIRLTDPFTEHISDNYFLAGSSNLVPAISLEFSSNSSFTQLVITGNHFSYLAAYSDEVIDLGASTQYQHADTAGVTIRDNTFQGYSGTSQVQGNNGADNLGETFICPQTTSAVRAITGATPNVKGATVVSLTQSGATNVTALGGGLPGQVLTVLIGDGNSTFVHATGLKMRSGGNWTPGSADAIIFAYNGSNWREVARTPQVAITSEIVTDVSITGSDAVTTFGRFFINLSNTAGAANTITLNAPSASDDGRILVLHVAGITGGTAFTLADSGNCALSAAWATSGAATVGSTLTLVAKGTVWKEMARSTNS